MPLKSSFLWDLITLLHSVFQIYLIIMRGEMTLMYRHQCLLSCQKLLVKSEGKPKSGKCMVHIERVSKDNS